jgi:hypothetical protein
MQYPLNGSIVQSKWQGSHSIFIPNLSHIRKDLGPGCTTKRSFAANVKQNLVIATHMLVKFFSQVNSQENFLKKMMGITSAPISL